MKNRGKNFISAVSLLIGTIIGVGIFGLPYVAAKVGVLVTIGYIILLGLVTMIISMAYAEIICCTSGNHRLVGYSEKYLGKMFKLVATFSLLFGFFGSLLAYVIVSGQFLQILLADVFSLSAFSYSLIFLACGSILIYAGIKSIVKTEVFMTIFLIAIIVLLFFVSLGKINTANLMTVDWKNIFLPYGIVLFSLGGLSAIPEMTAVVKGDKEIFGSSIKWGIIISAFLYILFILAVVGVTGSATSQEAISGLIGHLSPQIILVGALFGFFAIATSFLSIGLNLKHSFIYDYKLSHNFSWLLAMSIPFFLFVVGIGQFISIISLIGVVAGGIDGILVILVYNKIRQKHKKTSFFQIPLLLQLSIVILFTLGIIYHFIY